MTVIKKRNDKNTRSIRTWYNSNVYKNGANPFPFHCIWQKKRDRKKLQHKRMNKWALVSVFVAVGRFFFVVVNRSIEKREILLASYDLQLFFRLLLRRLSFTSVFCVWNDRVHAFITKSDHMLDIHNYVVVSNWKKKQP